MVAASRLFQMGTRGYTVYRTIRNGTSVYKRLYHQYDSYPSGLGVIFLNNLDAEPDDDDCCDSEESDIDIQKVWIKSHELPENDLFIEWIYMCDQPRNILWVNNVPFCRLDHPPSAKDFAACFAEQDDHDSYYHQAPYKLLPEEYRCQWDYEAPTVHHDALDEFTVLAPGHTVVSVHEMLEITSTPSNGIAVHIRVLEMLVSQIMYKNHHISRQIRWSGASPMIQGDDEESAQTLIHDIQELARKFLALVAHPSHFFDHGSLVSPKDIDSDWPRHDVCTHIAFHLDSPPNLQAAIVQIVHKVNERTSNAPDVVYGLLFDVKHCCIVRIKGGKVIEHTGCIPFLPSHFATVPSTEGITALARLFHRRGSGVLARIFDNNSAISAIPTTSGTTLPTLPVDVVGSIAAYIYDIETLVSLARASDTWYDTVETTWTSSASVPGYILVRAVPFVLGDELGVASFDAVSKESGQLARIILGEKAAKEAAYGRRFKEPFAALLGLIFPNLQGIRISLSVQETNVKAEEEVQA